MAFHWPTSTYELIVWIFFIGLFFFGIVVIAYIIQEEF